MRADADTLHNKKQQQHTNDEATFEGVGGGADLAVLGPEVQRGQEEGGELGLLSVQLFFLHVSDVLPQDAHQRPQLSLWGSGGPVAEC